MGWTRSCLAVSCHGCCFTGMNPQCCARDRAGEQSSCLLGLQMGTVMPNSAHGMCHVPTGSSTHLAPCDSFSVPAVALPHIAGAGRGGGAAAGTRHDTAHCPARSPSTCMFPTQPLLPQSVDTPVPCWGLGETWAPGVPVLQPLRWAPHSWLPRGSSRFMFAKFCLVKP